MVAIEEETVLKKTMPDGSSDPIAGISGTSHRPSPSTTPTDTSSAAIENVNVNEKCGNESPATGKDCSSKDSDATFVASTGVSMVCDPAPLVIDFNKSAVTSENNTVAIVGVQNDSQQTSANTTGATTPGSSSEFNESDAKRIGEVEDSSSSTEIASDTVDSFSSIAMDTNSEDYSKPSSKDTQASEGTFDACTDDSMMCDATPHDIDCNKPAITSENYTVGKVGDQQVPQETNASSTGDTITAGSRSAFDQSDVKKSGEVESSDSTETASNADDYVRSMAMDTNSGVNSDASGQTAAIVNDRSCGTITSQETSSDCSATSCPQDVTTSSTPDNSTACATDSLAPEVKVNVEGSLPSKALTLLVGYGVSSDSDESMESDNEVDEEAPPPKENGMEGEETPPPIENGTEEETPPPKENGMEEEEMPPPKENGMEEEEMPPPKENGTEEETPPPKENGMEEEMPPPKENVTEKQTEHEPNKDAVEVPATSASTDGQNGILATTQADGNDLPIIDLTSTNYRFTIDIGSGTDDSESDSDGASSSSSSSSSSEASSLSENEQTVSEKPKKAPPVEKPENQAKPGKKKRNHLLTPGELSIDDLPPIEDLKISVPEDQAHVIGFVHNIVERQVVVQGHHGIPPIDLDSVLFLDNGQKMLGRIFDVFGHVQEPLYVVRFNSSDHVKENKINKGEPVFYAPTTEHTNYVLIDALMRMKGSDASGLTDNEPHACDVTDFSDDEEEAKARGHSKHGKFNSSTGEFQPSWKRSRNQGNGGGEGRGAGRGRGGGRGQGQGFNPFSERWPSQRDRNNFDRHPMMQQKFDPRNSNAGPSRFPTRPAPMQGPPFGMDNGNYGTRPFSPFPNQVEMNGNMGHNMDPHFAGPNQNGHHCQSPNPWASQSQQQQQQQQQPHHPPPSQFGGPPQFPNQRMGFPPPNAGMPQTPPPLHPHCPPSFSPRASHPPADYQTFGPPTTPTPPCSPYYSPRPQNNTCFQSMGPPSFSPQPHNPPGAPFQNVGPPPMPSYSPSVSPRPHYQTSDYLSMPPPPSHVDPAAPHHHHPPSPTPPGAMNGGWLPQGPAPPPYNPPPPPPPPPSHPPPSQSSFSPSSHPYPSSRSDERKYKSKEAKYYF